MFTPYLMIRNEQGIPTLVGFSEMGRVYDSRWDFFLDGSERSEGQRGGVPKTRGFSTNPLHISAYGLEKYLTLT